MQNDVPPGLEAFWALADDEALDAAAPGLTFTYPPAGLVLTYTAPAEGDDLRTRISIIQRAAPESAVDLLRARGGAVVRVQNPVRLSDRSEPEPDLVLAALRSEFVVHVGAPAVVSRNDDGTVRVPRGAHVTCTVTNVTATLTLLKHVEDADPDTGLVPAAWTLTATPDGGAGLAVEDGDVARRLEDDGVDVVEVEDVGLSQLGAEVALGDAGPAEVIVQDLGPGHEQDRPVVEHAGEGAGALAEGPHEELEAVEEGECERPLEQGDAVEHDRAGDHRAHGDGHGEVEARHLREAAQPDQAGEQHRDEVDPGGAEEDGEERVRGRDEADHGRGADAGKTLSVR